MQVCKRGSQQYRFNILNMETYMLCNRWEFPYEAKKRIRIKSGGNEELYETPKLYHLLAPRYEILSGTFDSVNEWMWIDIPDETFSDSVSREDSEVNSTAVARGRSAIGARGGKKRKKS